MIGITGISLTFFILARDPRSKFPISKGIDFGIILLVIAAGVAITALYLNDIIILKGDFVIATIFYIGAIITIGVFYPILYFNRKRK